MLMPTRNLPAIMAILFLALTFATGHSTRGLAADCSNTAAGFKSWVGRFKSYAAKRGITARTYNRAMTGVSYSKRVIRLDRNQRSFKQSFAKFYRRRASKGTINKGRRLMKRHRRLLSRIHKRYGVPPEMLITIWGLETYYGANGGKMPIIPLACNSRLRLPFARVSFARKSSPP